MVKLVYNNFGQSLDKQPDHYIYRFNYKKYIGGLKHIQVFIFQFLPFFIQLGKGIPGSFYKRSKIRSNLGKPGICTHIW